MVFWSSHVFCTCIHLSVTRMCFSIVSGFEMADTEEQCICITHVQLREKVSETKGLKQHYVIKY